MAIIADARMALMIRPNVGAPFDDVRPKIDGNRPSSATASGSCPTIRIQPFKAPTHEIAAPMETIAAAPFPASARAASAYGAVDWPSTAGETAPITPIVPRT